MMVFVKMCREAVELQELWKPKSGDLYHYHGVINPLRPLMVKTDVHGGVMDWDRGEFFKNCFWLPRQEDLQELIINQTHLIPARILMLIYDEFEFIPAHLPEKSKISIATLQVAMGMYNKRWNGTTWETIK